MSHLFATAGSKLYIGGTLPGFAYSTADLTTSSFEGQDWTEIGGTTNLGGAGDTSELITSNQVGVARTRKLKGVRNAGSMQVVADIDYADPGQLALIAAEKERDAYAFRLVFNDAPPGGTPSERLFFALVMSALEEWNEANSVMSLNATLEIDSNIVRVSAVDDGAALDNTVLPVITGTAEVGQTLTVAPGTWTGTPAPSLSYKWFSGGESIPGATGTTYQLQASDEGNTVTVLETATNPLGTAHAMSLPTATVTGS